MKHVIVSMFIVLIPLSVAFAQIPNAGFETWSGDNPAQWMTDNTGIASYDPIVPTTDAHTGSYALKASVIQVYSVVAPPILLAGADGNGFPVSSRPTSLHGFFKTNLVGGDSVYFSIMLVKSGNYVGGGQMVIAANYSSYTDVAMPISYYGSDIPDSGLITLGIEHTVVTHAGSYFILDDLSFSNATGVSEHQGQTPAVFSLSQNYPNPFNPMTSISYALPTRSQVRLEVFTLLGERVATLVNTEEEAGNYTVNWTPKTGSGTYFYRIQAGAHTAVGKMILAR